MSSVFGGIVNMMGEPVIVYRATRAAKYSEARNQPRGRERDIHAPIQLGNYRRNNRDKVKITAIISSEQEDNRKRESGEIREAGMAMKSCDRVYITDNATADYADVIWARNEFWRVRTTRFDRLGGLWVTSLGKLSDDECVDIGVGHSQETVG